MLLFLVPGLFIVSNDCSIRIMGTRAMTRNHRKSPDHNTSSPGSNSGCGATGSSSSSSSTAEPPHHKRRRVSSSTSCSVAGNNSSPKNNHSSGDSKGINAASLSVSHHNNNNSYFPVTSPARTFNKPVTAPNSTAAGSAASASSRNPAFVSKSSRKDDNGPTDNNPPHNSAAEDEYHKCVLETQAALRSLAAEVPLSANTGRNASADAYNSLHNTSPEQISPPASIGPSHHVVSPENIRRTVTEEAPSILDISNSVKTFSSNKDDDKAHEQREQQNVHQNHKSHVPVSIKSYAPDFNELVDDSNSADLEISIDDEEGKRHKELNSSGASGTLMSLNAKKNAISAPEAPSYYDFKLAGAHNGSNSGGASAFNTEQHQQHQHVMLSNVCTTTSSGSGSLLSSSVSGGGGGGSGNNSGGGVYYNLGESGGGGGGQQQQQHQHHQQHHHQRGSFDFVEAHSPASSPLTPKQYTVLQPMTPVDHPGKVGSESSRSGTMSPATPGGTAKGTQR